MIMSSRAATFQAFVTEKLTDLSGLVEHLHSDFRGLQSEVTDVNHNIETMSKRNFESTLEFLNPWDSLSSVSHSTTATRIDNLRGSFLKEYELDGKNEVCMVTGERGNLALAHILPLKAKDRFIKCLGMNKTEDENGLNNFRNCILVLKGVEEALDEQRISIIRSSNILLDNEYVVKVWDEKVKDTFQSGKRVASGKTIGDIDGKHLNLNMPNGKVHRPFKRTLSFHNFWCFMTWSFAKKHYELGLDTGDFGSVGEWNEALALERKKWTTDLRRIIRVEAEEQDENESADSRLATRDEAGEQEVDGDEANDGAFLAVNFNSTLGEK